MSNSNSTKGGINIGQINNYGGGQTNVVQGDLHQVYNAAGTSVISVDGLIQILQQVEAMIAQSAIDQPQKSKIQADIRATITESQKETPHKETILSNLERIFNFIGSLGKAVAATQTIVPMLKQAYDWAQKLF